MTGPTTGLGFGSVFDVTATNAAFDFVRLARAKTETQRSARLSEAIRRYARKLLQRSRSAFLLLGEVKTFVTAM
jgi:hypothetical protein